LYEILNLQKNIYGMKKRHIYFLIVFFT